MTLIARLLTQYALWIYVLCAIGILFYLRMALSARREGSQAVYSLERETSAKRVYRASGMTMALLAVVVAVYALSHYVELPQPETSPIELSTETPDADPTAEPTSSATPATVTTTPQATATRRPLATMVVIPTPVGETPAPPPASASCPHPNVQVSQPAPNAVVDQGIQRRQASTVTSSSSRVATFRMSGTGSRRFARPYRMANSAGGRRRTYPTGTIALCFLPSMRRATRTSARCLS
jgi:type IV secretory pathway VirB10-like protein